VLKQPSDWCKTENYFVLL